jgi:hypothetical protein
MQGVRREGDGEGGGGARVVLSVERWGRQGGRAARGDQYLDRAERVSELSAETADLHYKGPDTAKQTG